MSLVEDILIVLSSYSGGYRLMRARMRGIPSRSARTYRNPMSDAVMRVTLSRLKRKGFVQNQKGEWHITKKGREHLSHVRTSFPNHTRLSRLGKQERQKNMIITFDIPEIDKYKRDWLRMELIGLGFEMLQKSVWFGPSPLPNEFAEALSTLKILPHLKFFEAKEADII